jgi:hypothetical protein
MVQTMTWFAKTGLMFAEGLASRILCNQTILLANQPFGFISAPFGGICVKTDRNCHKNEVLLKLSFNLLSNNIL